MENKDVYEDISSIKTIMERSTKFISLSGLSGVMAGIYALTGVATLFFLSPIYQSYNIQVVGQLYDDGTPAERLIIFISEYCNAEILIITGLIVLLLSVGTGFFLTKRKASDKGLRIWNESSRALLKSAIIPLTTGAFAILIVIYKGNIAFVFIFSLL